MENKQNIKNIVDGNIPDLIFMVFKNNPETNESYEPRILLRPEIEMSVADTSAAMTQSNTWVVAYALCERA